MNVAMATNATLRELAAAADRGDKIAAAELLERAITSIVDPAACKQEGEGMSFIDAFKVQVECDGECDAAQDAEDKLSQIAEIVG